MSKRKVLLAGAGGAFGFGLAEGLRATTDLVALIAGHDLTHADLARVV